jgi:hypothetical protein
MAVGGKSCCPITVRGDDTALAQVAAELQILAVIIIIVVNIIYLL